MLSHQKRKFKIIIHNAKIENVKRRIKDADALTTFCETRFDLDSAKTKLAKKSNTPSWDVTHILEGCSTTIEVGLYNKKGFKNSILARCVVNVEGPLNLNEQWFKFEDEETAQCSGEIRLSISDIN